MGTSGGFLLVDGARLYSKEEAYAVLRRGFQDRKEAGAFDFRVRLHEMHGVPLEVTAQMQWSKVHAWLCVTDTVVAEGEGSEDGMRAAAEQYAHTFGTCALAIYIVDSDFSILVFSDPARGISEMCYGGNPEGYVETSEEQREAPGFLMPYLNEAGTVALKALWTEHFILEDDRIWKLVQMFGGQPGVLAPDSCRVKGVECLSIDYSELD